MAGPYFPPRARADALDLQIDARRRVRDIETRWAEDPTKRSPKALHDGILEWLYRGAAQRHPTRGLGALGAYLWEREKRSINALAIRQAFDLRVEIGLQPGFLRRRQLDNKWKVYNGSTFQGLTLNLTFPADLAARMVQPFIVLSGSQATPSVVLDVSFPPAGYQGASTSLYHAPPYTYSERQGVRLWAQESVGAIFTAPSMNPFGSMDAATGEVLDAYGQGRWGFVWEFGNWRWLPQITGENGNPEDLGPSPPFVFANAPAPYATLRDLTSTLPDYGWLAEKSPEIRLDAAPAEWDGGPVVGGARGSVIQVTHIVPPLATVQANLAAVGIDTEGSDWDDLDGFGKYPALMRWLRDVGQEWPAGSLKAGAVPPEFQWGQPFSTGAWRGYIDVTKRDGWTWLRGRVVKIGSGALVTVEPDFETVVQLLSGAGYGPSTTTYQYAVASGGANPPAPVRVRISAQFEQVEASFDFADRSAIDLSGVGWQHTNPAEE